MKMLPVHQSNFLRNLRELRASATVSKDDAKSKAETVAKETKLEGSAYLRLPRGKSHHYFLSHKKEHSIWSETSEQLGLRIKDVLEEKNGLLGWFDGW